MPDITEIRTDWENKSDTVVTLKFKGKDIAAVTKIIAGIDDKSSYDEKAKKLFGATKKEM